MTLVNRKDFPRRVGLLVDHVDQIAVRWRLERIILQDETHQISQRIVANVTGADVVQSIKGLISSIIVDRDGLIETNREISQVAHRCVDWLYIRKICSLAQLLRRECVHF